MTDTNRKERVAEWEAAWEAVWEAVWVEPIQGERQRNPRWQRLLFFTQLADNGHGTNRDHRRSGWGHGCRGPAPVKVNESPMLIPSAVTVPLRHLFPALIYAMAETHS